MSLSSGSLRQEEHSPSRSDASDESSPEVDDEESLIQIGSRSTIYISSSPRRRDAVPLREETLDRRSSTPPILSTVQTWRERTRQARSEVSSVVGGQTERDTSTSERSRPTTNTVTGTGTSTLTSLMSRSSETASGRTILEIGSSTGTDVVASSLSYRNTADASLLGDSSHGSSSFESRSLSPIRTRRNARGHAQRVDGVKEEEGYSADVSSPQPRAQTPAPRLTQDRTGASLQSLSYVDAPSQRGDV